MVNQIVAAVLSFIIPGLGQITAGETKKGLIFLVILIILYAITFYYNFGLKVLFEALIVLFGLYAAYDAYQITRPEQKETPETSKA